MSGASKAGKPFEWNNVRRNLFGHALVAAALAILFWLFWHTDGSGGRYLHVMPGPDGVILDNDHAFLAARLGWQALLFVASLSIGLLILAAFVLPRKATKLPIIFGYYDPYRLANLGRLIGVAIVLVVNLAWSDDIIHALAGWINAM